MTTPPFILLPPSESKASGGVVSNLRGTFDDVLRSQRSEVVKALRNQLTDATTAQLEKFLGVRGDRLTAVLAATRRLASRRVALLPAWQRYNGVVWTHLGPATLTSEQRRRLLIPSGLYGVTTGDDPIGDYRLKMSVSLEGPGKLANFWREPLSLLLRQYLEGAVVYDLLPKEHAQAISWEQLSDVCDLRRVSFLRAGGDLAAGHAAKSAKGALARLLLAEGPDAFETFRFEGWKGRRRKGEWHVVAP